MLYISAYRPAVPIPKVYAAQYTPNNPAGVPFILMEKMPGSSIHSALWERERLSRERKNTILSELAKIHVELSRPLPFKEMGSLFLRGSEHLLGYEDPVTPEDPIPEEIAHIKWRVGPLCQSQVAKEKSNNDSFSETDSGHTSIASLWRYLFDREFFKCRSRWVTQGPEPTSAIIDSDRETDADLTTGDFAEVFRDLHSLVTSCAARLTPSQSSRLGICHPDFAYSRNVLFDENDKITAVLDWDDAAVLPLILLARFPAEFDYTWNHVPEDTLSFPDVEFEHSWLAYCDLDYTWDRWYYASRLAAGSEVYSGQFWKGVELPMTLHACATRGWKTWLFNRKRVAEMVNELAQQPVKSPSS